MVARQISNSCLQVKRSLMGNSDAICTSQYSRFSTISTVSFWRPEAERNSADVISSRSSLYI